MRRIIIGFLMVVIFSGLFSCGRSLKKYEFKEYLMNTVFQIIIYTDLKKDQAGVLAAETFRICHQLEMKYSTTITDSLVSKINKDGYSEIDSETYRVVKDALEFSKKTGGMFDITVYPLMKTWGFYDQNYRLPGINEIKSILPHVNYRYISLSSNRIVLQNGVKIDLGGIMKGYAIHEMVSNLQAHNITAGIVNAGGNLKVFGRKPDGSPWRIGIRHPRSIGELFSTVELKPDLSIATSGDYEQYFITNNTRYHHIMNPKTGFPVKNGVISASVITSEDQDFEDSDGYSSSFFALGPEKGIDFANKNHIPVLYILESNKVISSTNSIWWK